MVSYILEHPVVYKVINNNLLLNKKYNNVFKKNNIPNARHIHTGIISCISQNIDGIQNMFNYLLEHSKT